MDLSLLALEEISLEGLEGTTINGLWKLILKRRPPIKCAIDQWTKPFIWNRLAMSPFIEFFHVNFDLVPKPPIPKNPSERNVKLPPFWINDHINKNIGYCKSYFQRENVSDQIKGEEKAKLTIEEASEKWGEFFYIVARQDVRRRYLFGTNNPPIIEEVIPVRYIILEIIGKTRWEGFMQADFLKFYGMDSRTSFHHLKVLIRLRLLTKQSILLKGPVNNPPAVGSQVVPPKSTKMLHLSPYSNVYTNNLQKAAAKICSVLESNPDGIMERNELKQACSEIPMFKKIRQWLFQTGHIQYIVNGEVWNSNNANPIQLSHFRAGRPCYVNLLKKFDVTDVEEENDEFIDYIENCDDIEPQLVYEETLHHQAYQVILACREKGITMKKLAEVLCVPFTMARSFIRYFDTNKFGRIINVDHLKLKVQKIVAIQFLHQSETVQKIKSNKLKIAQHKAFNVDENEDNDEKPLINVDQSESSSLSLSTLKEKNLELADEVDLTRVSIKSKVSVRHLSRKNYVMDAMKQRPVFEGSVDLYKSLVLSEENMKSTQGQCCRKTFRKILITLIDENQIKKIIGVVDDSCTPPLTVTFFCAMHITEGSQDYLDALDSVVKRHENHERKKELKKAVFDPQGKNAKQKPPPPEEDSAAKIVLDFNQPEGVVTDTDDENFQRSAPLSTARDVNSKFVTYARFQKLHVLHIYLWHLIYGTNNDIEEMMIGSHSLSNDIFIDLIQSRHIWLQQVNGLPEYKEGHGWFNVGDILALMPLEVTCRVLGIKCWSETAIKFLQDPKKRLLKMCELPPRLKYKLLVSQANRLHIDNCVDLLVLMAQMGLIAVAPNYYPKVRTEIMLFLRKEAKITDTRFSEKTYCHVVLPPSLEKFPETIYRFKTLADVEKYWTDLQFVCLNTPLGLNRAQRTIKSEQVKENLSEDDIALGKQGLNQSAKGKGLGRNFRSFTILKDFTQYYQDKDFSNLEPVVFGNGLGAGGLDAVFFAHLAKNWRYGKQRNKKVNVKVEEDVKDGSITKVSEEKAGRSKINDDQIDNSNKPPTKMIVTSLMVKQRKGGKGLKRKLASTSNVLTKKMKMERKKYFDRMIAKRIENVREKIRQQVQKKKANRKGKKALSAMNHDDVDREALKRMKGIRVSFSEREDAYVLLAEIVRSMMKLYEKGHPLEKEHKKVLWQAMRDLIHKEVPESCDKTWEALDRRARNIKKHSHFLIIYNTCVAELEQDKEFMESLKCTKENWKEKMVSAFSATRESYSRHFNYPMNIDKFPTCIEELNDVYDIEFAHQENDGSGFRHVDLKNEREVRTSVLEDLIHCCLTAQKLTTYIPAVAFKVFDAYPPDELNEAFEYYKENRLISRYRVDLPRRRSLPISTMTYNLSTTYYRMFEPIIPLRIYQMARSMYLHMREGKEHSLMWKESDIIKLPNYYEKGSCLIDCTNLQGGHITYLLSALANEKTFLDFSLPDEMTISDEMHLKRLKEGKLNYQRVAFEQRIRRGETLVEKKLKMNKKDNRLLSSHELSEDSGEGSNIPNLSRRKQTKKNVTFDVSNSSNVNQHGSIRGFLKSNLFSCSYNSFRSGETMLTILKQSQFNQQYCFMYTNEVPKTKRRLLAEKINMFKESKLHASRTSLSMQRSLTGEKFVPTNAMNTHDALVTNPMEIIIHTKSSPFRNLLPKLKLTNTQKEIWDHFCDQADDKDESDELMIEEYCDLLKEQMNFDEFEIEDHKTIINKVHTAGVVGLRENKFKEIFSLLLSPTTLSDYQYHIQVLLNFKMIHSVGHYDNLFVSSTYLPTWCFRCPQVTSQFESEINKSNALNVSTQDTEIPEKESGEKAISVDESNESNQNNETTKELIGLGQDNSESLFESIQDHGSIPSETSATSIIYKNIKVLPWLKLNGELNNVILKRFHETVLVYIIANPGVYEADVLKHFSLLLKPSSAQKILHFLEINGAITKHYMWKKKPFLFASDDEQSKEEAYYMPTMQSLLNMTDTNR